jgi:hypothetical protein
MYSERVKLLEDCEYLIDVIESKHRRILDMKLNVPRQYDFKGKQQYFTDVQAEERLLRRMKNLYNKKVNQLKLPI